MSGDEAGEKSEADAGKIEATRTIVEAGLLEFSNRDRWGESEEQALTRVYRSMELARRLGWEEFWRRYLGSRH